MVHYFCGQTEANAKADQTPVSLAPLEQYGCPPPPMNLVWDSRAVNVGTSKYAKYGGSRG